MRFGFFQDLVGRSKSASMDLSRLAAEAALLAIGSGSLVMGCWLESFPLTAAFRFMLLQGQLLPGK